MENKKDNKQIYKSKVLKVVMVIVVVSLIAAGAFMAGRTSEGKGCEATDRFGPEGDSSERPNFPERMNDGGKGGRPPMFGERFSGKITKIDGNNLTVNIDNKDEIV